MAIRPSEIVAARHATEDLGGIAGVDLGAVSPVLRELIPPVHGGIERTRDRMDGERHRIAETGGETTSVRERLSGAAGGECPDAGARFELGARIMARGARDAVVALAAVRPRA